ncbi:hypothetical protein LOZ57_004722 [Ophidiomyces ophidiicola]|uniref:uncharacterized protein n=1 Tax=Ophidiomyces ophidiicola TaxID=1387563 RepID=UPI0020C3BA9B|nr:uncharacterized protein LOZ57_004722 [Ophidiomyces ophidiicola]KAI1944709.1 hypothetical protein LOZ57_004722 [Ophidiomyces ophidiicola]KAI2057859.1 hypothetical protein LOZ43_002890 [Ophidiomyces ophidiicola]
MLKVLKETKVSIQPDSTESIVNISVPSPQQPAGHVEFAVQHHSPIEDGTSTDKFLATQASVYFRKRKTYPRCILWRVVGSDRVLELRSADLTRSVHEPQEADLTLRLNFPDVILPHGVGLSDEEDDDAISIFVITASRQLYTLDLQSHCFLNVDAIKKNVADWCKAYRPPPLSFTHPYLLCASTPLEVFISLHSGALLRLTRKSGTDGSSWSLITFDERPWSASLRGFVKRGNSNSVQNNGKSLDPNTPTAIAITPDQAFVVIICLNHSLKIWNLASHRLVASKDLLASTSRSDALPNPTEFALIRVFTAETTAGAMYYMITFTPHDDSQFKVWAVKGSLTSHLEIENMFPDSKLKAIEPNSPGHLLWNITDFEVVPSYGGKTLTLWVLWRGNGLYQLHSIRFDLQNLPNVWQSNWTRTALEIHSDLPPTLLRPGMVDPTSEWLEFIFSPGRYPLTVIQASLSIFLQPIKPNEVNINRKKPSELQQQACQAIQDSLELQRCADGTIDFSRYCKALDGKWRRLWHIIEGVNRKRFETLSLAYDRYSDSPWVLFTDGCALFRECSSTEVLFHNDASSLRENLPIASRDWLHPNSIVELGDHPDESAKLVSLAASFRKMLNPELSRACRSALHTELFMEISLSAEERLLAFHERCGFSDLLTDNVYEIASANIDQSLQIDKLSTDMFFAVLDTIPSGFSGRDSNLLSTKFGYSVVMEGVMETIYLIKQTFYDLLLLIVFIDVELKPENSFDLNGPELFATIVSLLKEYELLDWLGSNTRLSPKGQNSGIIDAKSDHASRTCAFDRANSLSILEDLFASHIKSNPTVGVSQLHTLTRQIRDVISWATRQGGVSLENVLVYIQCDLISSGNIDLATNFFRFQPNTSWSTYVKGRLYLAKCDFDAAAASFQRSSYTLSYGKPIGDLQEMSSNLIDSIAKNSFYNGLPQYLLHVAGLFEQAKSPTHAAHFLELALQASGPNDPDFDLMPHLFRAYLKTNHIDKAYATLLQHPDGSVSRSDLEALVETSFAVHGSNAASFRKFLRLPLYSNSNICNQLDEILASLAEKQKLSPPPGSQRAITPSSMEYLTTLKAIHIARSDFENAARTSYQILCRLRETKKDLPTNIYSAELAQEDADPIMNELLELINLLELMESDEAYVLVDPSQYRTSSVKPDEIESGPGTGQVKSPPDNDITMYTPDASVSDLASPNVKAETPKKAKPSAYVVLTLDSLRREYQTELDRMCKIQAGDWEYGDVQTWPVTGDNNGTI